MAGQLPSFLTGGMAIIRIGDVRIAYCQNLRISGRMDNTAVYGVGSYGPHSLEPVMHGANFSLQITRYTSDLFNKFDTEGTVDLPNNLQNTTDSKKRDGNSVIDSASFNPQLLLLSSTFDIAVYERKTDYTTAGGVGTEHGLEGKLIYTLEDCRLSNYSFNFAPGELLIENVSGLARVLKDSTADPS